MQTWQKLRRLYKNRSTNTLAYIQKYFLIAEKNQLISRKAAEQVLDVLHCTAFC